MPKTTSRRRRRASSSAARAGPRRVLGALDRARAAPRARRRCTPCTCAGSLWNVGGHSDRVEHAQAPARPRADVEQPPAARERARRRARSRARSPASPRATRRGHALVLARRRRRRPRRPTAVELARASSSRARWRAPPRPVGSSRRRASLARPAPARRVTALDARCPAPTSSARSDTPPSTTRHSPVIQRAARARAGTGSARATSSAVREAPERDLRAHRARAPPRPATGSPRAPSDSNGPGAIALTRMPWRAHSAASVLRQRQHAGLRAGRVHDARHAGPGVRRDDVQDLPAACAIIARPNSRRAVERAVEHDPEHRAPGVRRHPLGRAHEVAGGVVDEHVDARRAARRRSPPPSCTRCRLAHVERAARRPSSRARAPRPAARGGASALRESDHHRRAERARGRG